MDLSPEDWSVDFVVEDEEDIMHGESMRRLHQAIESIVQLQAEAVQQPPTSFAHRTIATFDDENGDYGLDTRTIQQLSPLRQRPQDADVEVALERSQSTNILHQTLIDELLAKHSRFATLATLDVEHVTQSANLNPAAIDPAAIDVPEEEATITLNEEHCSTNPPLSNSDREVLTNGMRAFLARGLLSSPKLSLSAEWNADECLTVNTPAQVPAQVAPLVASRDKHLRPLVVWQARDSSNNNWHPPRRMRVGATAADIRRAAPRTAKTFDEVVGVASTAAIQLIHHVQNNFYVGGDTITSDLPRRDPNLSEQRPASHWRHELDEIGPDTISNVEYLPTPVHVGTSRASHNSAAHPDHPLTPESARSPDLRALRRSRSVTFL